MAKANCADRLESLFPTEAEIPEAYKPDGLIRRDEYLIDGEIRHWDGPMMEAYSPICIRTNTGSIERVHIGSFPRFTEKEALEALEATVRAYDNGRGCWPTKSVASRIDHVKAFVGLMKEKRDEIVKMIMWEVGKSLKDSEKEFDRTVDYILDTIDALKDLDRISSRFVITDGIMGQIRRAPLGTVLCMGPFNYPLNETFTTLIPALIMGNTVVFKPPKLGVLLHGPLIEAFREAFPPGTVNTIYGSGKETIPCVMKSGKIDVLAFIGTSKAADALKKDHPKPHRLRSCLGLEAKNAGIILPGADLDNAIEECITGTLSFNGQRCTALKTLFVHKKIADEFLSRFCDAVSALKCGMPWDEGVKITPLPEEGKPKWLTELIEDAVDHGAKVINDGGGTVVGTFFYPAVIFPVTKEMKIYSEEQFGPVIPVVPFDDIETPIRHVENSDYGQQVSIFGTDSDLIAKLIDPLVNQVCRVNINSQCQRGPDTFPFTGRKDSAEGTLSVTDALRVFTIRTLVASRDTDLNKDIINDIVRNHKSNFLSTDFIL
ncbi:MAG: NADP-dependent glyceraldehyde-3-phosphate dehydrogenase [bacterium]